MKEISIRSIILVALPILLALSCVFCAVFGVCMALNQSDDPAENADPKPDDPTPEEPTPEDPLPPEDNPDPGIKDPPSDDPPDDPVQKKKYGEKGCILYRPYYKSIRRAAAKGDFRISLVL